MFIALKKSWWASRIAGACATCLLVNAAWTQSFPTRPLHIVVPYAAGGSSDALVRTLGESLAKRMGQSVVVENRPGGSTIIGAQAVVAAPADGYMLLLNAASFTINPHLIAKMPYDTWQDFTAVTLVASNPHVLVVNPQVPANNLPQFIEWAKAHAGKATYASFGNGSSGHIGFESLKKEAGLDILHVPYKGSAPATTDLLAGVVDVMLADLPQVIPYIKAGKLKAIAIAADTRASTLPDVATFAEGGMPRFSSKSWYGLVARAGTPVVVVDRLNVELQKALRDPAVREKLATLGMDSIGLPSAQFAAFMQSESAKYAGVIKFANIRLD